MSNSLNPDQARHFVGPDLDPNCLQRLSGDDTGSKNVIFVIVGMQPGVPMGMPPALQYLASVDQLIIKQKKEMLESKYVRPYQPIHA